MLKAIKKFERDHNRKRRFIKTYDFLSGSIPKSAKILDLGTPNELSDFLKTKGYNIENTSGQDLDVDTTFLSAQKYDVVTGFEILEHLVNPMGVLKAINADKIVMSIPLRLWFSPSYKSKTDPWDRHYHEFEDWQFDWLIEKSGWSIIRREKWVNRAYRPGFRSILRWFYPRYYIIEATRNGAVS